MSLSSTARQSSTPNSAHAEGFKSQLIPHILVGMALGLVLLLIYRPGLSGGFLFDDFANLPALGRYGPVVDFNGLLRYLTSGIADPSGRPVAMLSFLLDANDWPAEPWSFKRTNLVIHVLNALTLYVVLLRLGILAGLREAAARDASALAAALWALHPLWVSTVLYVVQRHAMLATLFVLLGVWTWLAAQQRFCAGRNRAGWALALASVLGFGTLAGLSKPNGFLLPLLLLVLHWIFFCRTRKSTLRRPEVLALLVLPSLVIVGGLLLAGFADPPENRPWTIAERLLTQPRVIAAYLGQLFLPSVYSGGVFADDFLASRGLLDPPETLYSLVFILALVGASLALSRRAPIWASAALFYLAGHVLESTVVPLELYFEHRNYLPATLLFWPFAVLLTKSGPALKWRRLGAVGLLVLLGLLTLARASLWGQPLQLALMWANDLPDSARAQTNAAAMLIDTGRADLAIERLTPQLQRKPAEVQFAITLMNAHCLVGRVEAPMLAATASALSATGIGVDVAHQWLIGVLKKSESAPCRWLDDASATALVAAVHEHPKRDQEIESRLARSEAYLLLRQRRCESAVVAFNRRLDIQRRPEAALEQTGQLATHCGPDFGLRHLLHYRNGGPLGGEPPQTPILRLRDVLMRHQRYWEPEFERLEAVLRQDIAANGTAMKGEPD